VAEISAHNTSSDLWIVIDQKVFDVTQFQEEHPGGAEAFRKYAGSDASTGFLKIVDHEDNEDVQTALKKYQIGFVKKNTPIAKKAPVSSKKSINLVPVVLMAVVLVLVILFYK
jgi:cytochrome b involved in lipid metabolism